MITLALLLGGDAHAGYLCDLTQSEVESLLDDYGRSESFQEVAPYIATPFDCGTYGDLCNSVGADNALTFVCNRWDEMRNGDSVATIMASGDSDFESMSDDWFDERFPSGVGASHPWWGAFAPPPGSCSPTEYDYKVDSAGYWRIRGRSRAVRTYVYNKIASNTRAYFSSTGSIYFRVSGDVDVDADFKRYYSGGGYFVICATDTNSDSDGSTRVYRDRVFSYPYKYVSADHQFDNGWTLSVSTCKEAGWSDPGCY